MSSRWLVLPTVLLGLAGFEAGFYLFERFADPLARGALLLVSVLLALPASLFAIYYLHVIDSIQRFYEFRSRPFVELTAAGAGVLGGVLLGFAPDGAETPVRAVLSALLVVGLVVPYLKPILARSNDSEFRDMWADDVCLQSTPSSCGPACVATLLRAAGERGSEEELARESFTYAGGTEIWYLARALRRRGFFVNYSVSREPPECLPVPAIAGVKIGSRGHFIPILGKTETTYITGDPLVGRAIHSKAGIHDVYEFVGFFLVVRGIDELGSGVDSSREQGQ
jgi:hypothetical protein